MFCGQFESTLPRIERNSTTSWIALFVAFCLLFCQHAYGQSHVATERITLSGISKGGTLQLARVWVSYADVVTVTNAVGDDGNVVAARLAERAQTSPSFAKSCGTVKAISNQITVVGFPQQGNWILAGSDTGFNTVPPPTSLSVRYVAEENKVRLRWNNPPEVYSSIVITKDGHSLALLSGDATSFAYLPFSPRLRTDLNDSNYFIVGYRDGRPSGAAGIHLAANQQDELFNLPFVMGVAPNWNVWSNRIENAVVSFGQGKKTDDRTSFVKTPDMKPFYQRIGASGTNYTYGTWRSFLGLETGHTYRVKIRVNTLDSAPPGDWSFSVHVAHNGQNGKPFTPDQMSGLSPLPDGHQGADAGRIAQFDAATSTEGKWTLVSTGAPTPGKVVGDITLPQGAETITVWTRLRGHNVAIPGMGMDWVALEILK